MNILQIQSSIGDSRILVGERLENVYDYIPQNTTDIPQNTTGIPKDMKETPKNEKFIYHNRKNIPLDRKIIIVSDSNVIHLYGDKFPRYPVIDIGMGEGVKTLETVQLIYKRMLELEFDRGAFVLAIGGGIVCDVAGFAASTYMRGIEFGFVSTTLLSQVDASVGGKNGVNFNGYKNTIGNFGLPTFVICDMDLLDSLPKLEVVSGLSEVVKHGAIKDARLFDYIENNVEQALRLDKDVIARFVYDSVVIKSNIVNADARESGERKKLNFGHTFGHAVEKIAKIPHGMAVSIGMAVAAQLSVTYGLLRQEKADRLKRLLVKLGLPVAMEFDHLLAIDAMRKDKKREGEKIHFILLEDIGRAVIKEIDLEEVERMIMKLEF